MWLLKNENKGQVYKIKPNVENAVSRKDGDLVLADDQSISRRHAMLNLNVDEQKVILKDLGSKYGTSIKRNETEFKKVLANTEIEVNKGDVIKFGMQTNLWTLEYFPIVVTTSTLGHDEKTEIRQIISALNGSIVNNWTPQCTHLVMNKLTVTIKVVCALANSRCIVTPEYWKRLYKCLTSMQLPLPDVKDYIPELIEATLNPKQVSFIPNPMRKTLFSGTVFVASTPRQLGRIETMVTSGGGKVEEFSSSKAEIKNYLNEKRILMMHSAVDKQNGSQESQIPNGYKTITRMLKNQDLRCIPEPDIGLSILYCSMEQYCNPRFKVQILHEHDDSSEQRKEPSEIIVPETEVLSRRTSCTNVAIPETSSVSVNKSQRNSANNKKRNRDYEREETSMQKRRHKEHSNEEYLFDVSLPQPGTSRQTLEHGTERPSATRSPDLFSFPTEKNISSSLGSLKSNDPFDFPKPGPNSSNPKRPNTGNNIFNSIVEKNKRRKSEDTDFTFPYEREEKQHKLESSKRSRDKDSEFDFPSEWEDKRPKLNGGVGNNKKTNIDNSDPFSFPVEKVKPSKNLTKIPSSKAGLWDCIADAMKKDQSSNSERSEQEKGTDSLSDDEIILPKVNEEKRDVSFQICYDEEINKEDPKPIPLSSFITKPTIKKEIAEDDEEDLANRFNKTVEIQVKNLVVIGTPLQQIQPKQVQTNGVNFKKFKKNHYGLMQRLPYIIGGSDLMPYKA